MASRSMKEARQKNWIKGAIKHPGGLHKAIDVPSSERIPARKLEKAEHSRNPKIRKMAILAETLNNVRRNSKG